MRFFTLKKRSFALPEPKITAEIPIVSAEAQAAAHSTMQKAALAHERRTIDNKSNSIKKYDR